MDKLLSAALGSYLGCLVASGLCELAGVDVKGGVWWDWIAFSFAWATIVALPICIFFMFLVVPRFFDIGQASQNSQVGGDFALGSLLGLCGVILAFFIVIIFAVLFSGSLKGFSEIFKPFIYIEVYSVAWLFSSLVR